MREEYPHGRRPAQRRTPPPQPHRQVTNPYYQKDQRTAPQAEGQARRQAEYRRRQKRRRVIRRILMALLCVIVLAALVLLGLYIWLDNFVLKGDSLAGDVVNTAQEYQGDVVHLLVCGIDFDYDDDGRDYSDGLGMTDVILYISYDLKNQQMSILQIPRDSYVGESVSTGGTRKINAVYSHGEDAGTRVNNLARVINDQFKLPVDHYVTINMTAFKQIINILGGIEMYVPWDIVDDYGNTIPQGTHKMDGDTVEFVIRQRHQYAQGDIMRLEVQQYFYAAVFRTFLTFPKEDVIKTMPTVAKYTETDMSAADLIGIGLSFLNLDTSRIYMTKPGGGPIYIDGQSLFGIDKEQTAEILNQYFRYYEDPVPASALGLPGGFTYTQGQIDPSGHYLGDLGAEGAEQNEAA